MKIAIIGGGPAGFMAAITAKEQNPDLNITIFDKSKPLSTLFATGGGRCNLAYAEFDFKELASNFPRGEKFLYSVFSQFDTSSTFEFFERYGLELFTQEDSRVFPKSEKSIDVIKTLLNAARMNEIDIKYNFEINSIEKKEKFIINKKLSFDKIIIATGGKGKGCEFAKKLGHKITQTSPALCGMKTSPRFENISGLTLKNVKGKVNNLEISKDILFTHKGLSGPMIFEISSRLAFDKKPLTLTLRLIDKKTEQTDKELVEELNQNSQKNISNLLSKYSELPNSLVEELLKANQIPLDKKANQINSKERKLIANFLCSLEFKINENDKGAMVTAGGVCLDEVDNKTMQSKLVDGLYFCGEVLDIDGLTGGFNLQACWSTGYIVGTML